MGVLGWVSRFVVGADALAASKTCGCTGFADAITIGKKGISTTLLTVMGKHFVLAGKSQIDFRNLSSSVNHSAINVQPYMDWMKPITNLCG